MFEQRIDDTLVRIDLGPLAAWERFGFVDTLALLGAALVFSVVARALGPEPRAWAAAAPVVSLVLAGIGATFAPALDRSTGSPFVISTDLAARFGSIGVAAFATVAGAVGGLVALTVDVPAIRARRRSHFAAMAWIVVALALGAWRSAAVVACADRIAEIATAGPLPRVAYPESLRMHAGQHRSIAPAASTGLGLRAQLVILFWQRFVVTDPGSDSDLAQLREHRYVRAGLADDELEPWAGTTITVDAPDTPGPFEARAVVRRGPVTVERSVTIEAIEDRGDPRIPLAAGYERVLEAQPIASPRGAPAEPLRLTWRVSSEAVVDGLRVLHVVIAVPDGDDVEADVIPWAGAYVVRGEDGAPRPWIETAEASSYARHGAPLTGESCVVGRVVCDCAPLVGPTTCLVVGEDGGALVELGLGILTGGITWAAGAFPRSHVTLFRAVPPA